MNSPARVAIVLTALLFLILLAYLNARATDKRAQPKPPVWSCASITEPDDYHRCILANDLRLLRRLVKLRDPRVDAEIRDYLCRTSGMVCK